MDWKGKADAVDYRASGHVGKFVAREFHDHGYRVRALDTKPLPADLRALGIETRYIDITDPLTLLTAAEGCEGVIHLAALPNMGRAPSAAQLMNINAVGTYNILDAAENLGMTRAVITSSIGALGFSFPKHPLLPDYLPIDTAHPRRPEDVYGLSKLVNEETAAAMTRRTGMTTLVFRPPQVVNLEYAREQGWLTHRTEREARFDNSWWSYIDARDLARAYRLAWESPLTGHHVFHVMADDVFTRETPAELIEEFLPSLASYAGQVKGSLFDVSPARQEFGFDASLFWRDFV